MAADKSDRRFQDRGALVTGAASGIGRATAGRLAAEGAIVACADIDGDGASRTAAAIAAAGGRALGCRLDVLDDGDWDRAVALVQREAPLRLLVNAAGISHAAPVWDLTRAEWRRVMAVNVEGAVAGTACALRAMRAHGLPSAIVNVGSLSGTVAQPGASAYCASKAALRMFTRVAALECRREGLPIRITAVAPGGVKTPMWRSMDFFRELIAQTGSEEGAYAALTAGQPHARFAEPDEIARAILFLLSDEASFISGAELLADDAQA